jgi:hypothetical protein
MDENTIKSDNKPRCCNCRYYLPPIKRLGPTGIDLSGQCRIRAPSAVGGFPLVQAIQWCGEHSPTGPDLTTIATNMEME